MSYVLTFVASASSPALSQQHLQEIAEIFERHGVMQTAEAVWLSPDKAVDIGIAEQPPAKVLNSLRANFMRDKIDVFVNPIERRRKRLLMADMDSTIVTGETLDELAAFANLKDKIAAITTKAMEGQLDFHDAVRERVGLLKGLPVSALDETLALIKLSPGAASLVNTMRANDAYCVLVSGGFTFFTEDIAKKLSFHKDHGNELEIEKEMLTGKVREPIEDKHSKLNYLKQYVTKLKIQTGDVLAIGDGANDIPMLKGAGLGIGYHPKEVVQKELDNVIIHGDLSAALYAQGYREENIQ